MDPRFMRKTISIRRTTLLIALGAIAPSGCRDVTGAGATEAIARSLRSRRTP